MFSCYLISTVLSVHWCCWAYLQSPAWSPQCIQSDGYTCERLGNANGEYIASFLCYLGKIKLSSLLLSLLFCATLDKLSSPASKVWTLVPIWGLGGSMSVGSSMSSMEKGRWGFEEEGGGYSTEEGPQVTGDLPKNRNLSGPSLGPCRGDC